MKTTNKNNIGVLTYKKFDENVLSNSSFDIKQLFKIILHDKDFIRFEIFDKNKNLLLTTNPCDDASNVVIIHSAKVYRDEEIKWTNFNAYRTPMYIYGKKIKWKVNHRVFKTKKSAVDFAGFTNRNIAAIIEKFIDRD
ncbi:MULTISPECIES: hypothetical protein [Sphingobacterium]|uniref:Uncharacterized protein n=1 Tax=Sphingobacterium multivorum TaxID=28454 RepID=A0A2X2JJ94_SPHMU|nr:MULTISPECIES: hypothetical protein [Sphingobacterium]QRQ60039.1 hypothetical protein I6J33_18020 [Sphingobacterium multivorum]SPZ92091.1 Uncharacterised protein [Sphingobacterium multivorum]HBI87024.1 hypothetical protein [Sphingobacterium sp.]